MAGTIIYCTPVYSPKTWLSERVNILRYTGRLMLVIHQRRKPTEKLFSLSCLSQPDEQNAV